MFNAGTLTFREFMMREPLPLATIHDAILEFLQGRDDAVVFGAQAVNAYVGEPRMTQGVDLLSPRESWQTNCGRTWRSGSVSPCVRANWGKEEPFACSKPAAPATATWSM
jgi:hypothetical protein